MNRFLELLEMIFTNIKDYFGINVEVMVADNITHTFDLLPFNFRISCQEFIFRNLVQLFQALSDCDQLHAYRIELFHAGFGIRKVIN